MHNYLEYPEKYVIYESRLKSFFILFLVLVFAFFGAKFFDKIVPEMVNIFDLVIPRVYFLYLGCVFIGLAIYGGLHRFIKPLELIILDKAGISFRPIIKTHGFYNGRYCQQSRRDSRMLFVNWKNIESIDFFRHMNFVIHMRLTLQDSYLTSMQANQNKNFWDIISKNSFLQRYVNIPVKIFIFKNKLKEIVFYYSQKP